MKKDFLSHYTNVDTLEIILENKSIKMNRLKSMNDENEGRNIEGVETESIMYSSSWSEDISEDGIEHMWQMYTKYGSGIRISTERYPFKKYSASMENTTNESGKRIRTYLNPKIYINTIDSTLLANSIKEFKMLKKVIYTNDKNKYMPQVVEEDGHWTNIKIHELGTYKEKKWDKELEWRYLIILFNRGIFNEQFKHLSYGDQIKIMALLNKESLYLDLKGSSIRKMEVIMSKGLTDENKMKLYELSKKYKFKIIN